MVVLIIQGFPLAAYTYLRYKAAHSWDRPIVTIFAGALLVVLSPILLFTMLITLGRWENLDDVFTSCDITHLLTMRPFKIIRWKRSQTQSSEQPFLRVRSSDLDESPMYDVLVDSCLQRSFEDVFGDFVAELEGNLVSTIERRSKQSFVLTNLFSHCRFDTLDVSGDDKFSRSTLAPMYWSPSKGRKKSTTKKFVDFLFDKTNKTRLIRLGQMLMPTSTEKGDMDDAVARNFPYVVREDEDLEYLFPEPTQKPNVLEEWLRRFKAVDTDAGHDYYHFAILPLCVLLRGVDETVILEDHSPTNRRARTTHFATCKCPTAPLDSENIGSEMQSRFGGDFVPKDFVPKGQNISKNIACLVKGAAADKEERFLFQMRTEIDNMNEEIRSLQSLVKSTFDKDKNNKR